ncbi:hypothetical protein MRX96_056045 [Rhipicephalus microplus]
MLSPTTKQQALISLSTQGPNQPGAAHQCLVHQGEVPVKHPSHRYLCPGNPLRNGDPVDEDDGIAKSHDEAYE